MTRATSILVCLALLLASAAPALAEPNPDLERGVKLLKNMEDAKALEALQQALKRPQNTPQQVAQIYIHMGIAQSNLMQEQAARESFAEAIEADPSIKLPEMTSPKINKLFDEVKREATAAPPAKPEPAAPREDRTKQLAKAADRGTAERPSTNWPAWITLGGAAAVGVTGIALGALSRADRDKAGDLSLTYPEAKDYHDRGSSRALAANVLFAVAGAAAITSGVLFYLGWRDTSEARAVVVPTGAGVVVQVSGSAW